MRDTWLRVAKAISLLTAIVALAGFALVQSSSIPLKTLTFSADPSSFSNPERGWYDRITTIVTDRNFSVTKAGGISELHSYVQLDAFRDSPIDQTTLTGLSDGLAAVRAAGLKIILRFAYNQGPYPDSAPDASQKRIEQHLAQLAPVLAANVDVISSFEAGFIGAWGEWHTSTNQLDTNQSAKAQILKSILSAFPSSRDVALRYASDLRAIEGAPLSATVPDGGSKSRVGSHQDCFLSGEPNDTGTWARDGHTPAQDKALVASVGRYAVVGGETCNADVPSTTTCNAAIAQLSAMHFSYLSRDFEPNTLAKFKSEGCYKEIGDRLGYRLRAVSATLPVQVGSGQSIPVSLTIRNDGFASPFNKRQAYLVLSGPNRTVALPLNSDPRSWDPGPDITISQTLAVGATLPKGTYTVALWLPDSSPNLRNKPAYSIRLANLATWDPRTGYNVLGTTVITAGG